MNESQGPPLTSGDTPIMSFRFAIIRPTDWLSVIFSDSDIAEESVIFECDVLSDPDLLTEKQVETVGEVMAKMDEIIVSTLPLNAIERYPYV